MKDKMKGLGMGLDLLLKASDGGGAKNSVPMDLQQAENLFSDALHEDERGNFLEAYYYYRRMVDMYDMSQVVTSEKESLLLSRALNNAAIILSENGQYESARQQLEKAMEVCPENQVARENLDLLIGRE